MKKTIVSGILVALVALALVACGSNNTQTPVSLVTAAPTTAAATDAGSASGSSASSASAIPQALADVKADQVYTFQVDPSQTTVEYAVSEVLFGNKQITRGKTSTVDGQFKLSVQDGKPVVSLSNLQVDLRTLTSDNNMRDQAIRMQWLQSNQYPMATFAAKSVEGFPADAVQGKPYTFKINGDMTIRDITKPVTFDATVTVNGNTISGEATTDIAMKDFGFDPPEILGRFTVTDPATITIKGVANLVES